MFGTRLLSRAVVRQLRELGSEGSGWGLLKAVGCHRPYCEIPGPDNVQKKEVSEYAISLAAEDHDWICPRPPSGLPPASTLVQKWVRHLEKEDRPGEAPVMCLLCVEERLLQDEKMLNRLAWTSAYLLKHNLRNVILIGFDKDLQDKPHDFDHLPHRLAERLHFHGAFSHVFLGPSNPLSVASDDEAGIAVAEELLEEAMKTETVPIFTNLLDARNSTARVVADVSATAEVVARWTRPFRMLFLDPNEGVRSRMGSQSEVVELFPKLEAARGAGGAEDDDKVSDIVHLLSSLSELNAVSVVSPDRIMEELHQPGNGTLIKRSHEVRDCRSLDGVDLPRLQTTLEAAFRKPLKDEYFDFVGDKIHRVFVTENCTGAAIIVRDEGMPMPYLDKIAVHPEWQGRGISGSIWRRIHSEVPKMFWRSRVSNARANRFYYASCSGFWKLDDTWIVFWHGLDSYAEVAPVIEWAQKWPKAFHERHQPSSHMSQ